MAYNPPLERAIHAAGGVSALAGYLGIGPSAVANWTRLPARHLPRVEALTGIAGRELRPDLWEAPPTTALSPSEDRRTGEKAGIEGEAA